MDLNFYYSQHQVALIRARATTSAPERARHFGNASGIARRIETYQHAQGAAAGASWRNAAMMSNEVAL